MKTMRTFAVLLLVALLFASCKTEEVAVEKFSNRNGVWLWGSHMKEAPVQSGKRRELAIFFSMRLLLTVGAMKRFIHSSQIVKIWVSLCISGSNVSTMRANG